ncbi:MAG: methyltransferase domain-containing protein [Candidatus Magasanikbacteria bacterium]|nr:methyltransferase domain-containing protein [Candidatus Magasanikbacteria bacterium]
MAYHTGNEMVDPYLLFERAQLRPGMHVADLGCGRTGHVVFPAAVVLGERGIVYAVDILKDVLEIIQKRANTNRLYNIHTVWANLEHVGATAIPEKSLDVAFLVNTLVQADNRHGVLEEAKRLLKDKARLVIVDWARKGLKFGPQDERFVDFENIKKWANMHGFAFQEEFDVGRFHKGLVFFKQE